MERSDIEVALQASEAAVAGPSPPNLGATGFWRVVGALKRDETLVADYADRVATIDREAFRRWALFTVPIGLGTALAVTATVAGLVVISGAYYVDAPWNGLLLIAGTGILLVPTHGLGHLIVGRSVGMSFTHWFVGTIRRPQPGVKIDYATYLRTPAADRARMHAAGAVVTKTIPFLMLGAAWGMDAPGWAWAVLVALGIGQLVTDLVWSTKSSDWKKYRRERRYAAS